MPDTHRQRLLHPPAALRRMVPADRRSTFLAALLLLGAIGCGAGEQPGASDPRSAAGPPEPDGAGERGAAIAPTAARPALEQDGTAPAATAEPGAPGSMPVDILFLPIDDLGDWVGCYGHPQAKTPHIDALAARGMRFEHAYTPAPVCNPARAALLTGVPPHVSGVYHNNQDWREKIPDAISLPRWFKQHGWQVHGAGKIFHGLYPDEGAWDEYFAGEDTAWPARRQLPLHGVEGLSRLDWGPYPRAERLIRDWQVTRWVERALASRDPRAPSFFAAGIFLPHLPWYLPREYFERHPLEQVRVPEVRADDLEDLPPAGRAMADEEMHALLVENGLWEGGVQAYLAAISYADDCVGRILAALEASPRGANTIIVLWGDHGWHLGEKHHWRKFTLWERSARVPLVIVAPGITEPGSVCERPVNLMDLYPTLVELAGLPPREGVAGRSLVPLLEDPSRAWDHPSLTTYGTGNHGVSDGRFRYIRYAEGGEELYDLQADPAEWRNLAGDPALAGVRERLAAALPAESAPNDAPPGSK